jgi:hypothetical protein
MAFYCQSMLEIALELRRHDDTYGDMALKFTEHFLNIGGALSTLGMWDEEDGFFYDVLRRPDGASTRLKVRSIVGLLPICAATVFERATKDQMPELSRRFVRFFDARPELVSQMQDPFKLGVGNRRLASVVNESRLRRILERMLDENEFLSPYGIRSVSRYHAEHPYRLSVGGQDYCVDYEPAESLSSMFGGNSNWRGPIWMPVNGLIIRALFNYYSYYGDSFKVECPTGSGVHMNLFQVAKELTRRLENIFRRGPDGRRPVFGGTQKFQTDPHWRDNLLFYEYFHGDNGAGLGASHQTGWTGIIAPLIHIFATTDPARVLQESAFAIFEDIARRKETVLHV